MKTGNDVVYDMATTNSGSYRGAIATKRGVKFIEWDGGALVNMKIGLGCREFMVSCNYVPGTDKLLAGSSKVIIKY